MSEFAFTNELLTWFLLCQKTDLSNKITQLLNGKQAEKEIVKV